MADNKIVPFTGTGDATATIATDEIGGVNFQRIKLIHGADGTNSGDVSTANGLPVQATALTTADLNTGAGTDTRGVMGLLSAESTGGALVGSANPLPVTGAISSGAKYVDENNNTLTIKRAFANVATGSTGATVIAAVTSRKLRVLALTVVVGATAQTITFNTASSAISPAWAFAANGGLALEEGRFGYLETNSGEALTATTSSGGSTTGVLVMYVEVP